MPTLNKTASSYLSPLTAEEAIAAMVSISISLRRGSLSLSVSSLHSSSSYPYSAIPTSTSHEHLVPHKSKQSRSLSSQSHRNRRPRHTPPQINYQHLQAARLRSRKMASQPVEIEQKKSYGIGGAGNIRMSSSSTSSPLNLQSLQCC